MSTASAPDTTAETTALTQALLEAGWSYTSPIRTEPQWRSRIHELASPDGRLSVDAAVFPDGHMTARLSAKAVRTGPTPRPDWTADLHTVPLSAALAAVKAASEPEPEPDEQTRLAQAFGQNIGPHQVDTLLRAKGWEHSTEPDEDRDGRVTEIEWESARGHEFVVWNAEDRFDSGGWTVTHWHTDEHNVSRPTDTYASQNAPATVITALALADVPHEHADRGTPNAAPTPDGN